MKISKFLIDALSSTESVSSKRLFGGVGFVTSSIVVVYCTITGKQAPDIVELYLICSVSLVGLDSITGIWRGKYPLPQKQEKKDNCDVKG